MCFRVFGSVPTFCLSVILNLLACSWPILALAADTLPSGRQLRASNFSFTPPNRGLPGRREGGGTRGGDACTSGTPDKLVAFIPQTNSGLTTAEYPRLFLFVPKTTARVADFALYKLQDDEKNIPPTYQSIYQTKINITGKPGVIGISVPSHTTIPALESDRNYYWRLSLICNSQDRSRDIPVRGWLHRVSLSPTVNRQLEQLSPRDRFSIYSKYGIWFDALTTLADLRSCYPGNKSLLNSWANLLEAVQLQSYAQQPLTQQCANPRSLSLRGSEK